MESAKGWRKNDLDEDIARMQHRFLHTFHQKKYKLALQSLTTLFQLDPGLKDSLKDLYFKTLGLQSEFLEENQAWGILFETYKRSLELYPDSEELHFQLGTYIKKVDCKSSAILFFYKAVILNPDFTRARQEFEDLKYELVERWHFGMLNDTRRNEALEQAIARAVQRGCGPLLDIGAGTGILSMCAVKAGATQVYACELSTAMANVATEVLQLNGMVDQVQLLNKASTNLQIPQDLPARVSLVVTETFDAALVGENILATLHHAWQHLLLPPPPPGAVDFDPAEFGQVLPRKASAFVGLVEAPWLRQTYWFQGTKLCDLDLTGVQLVQKEAVEDPYTTEKLSQIPGGYSFLATSHQPIFTIDFNNPQEIGEKVSGFQACQQLRCRRGGHCDAVVLWFELDLGDGLRLSTRPPDSGCWDQAVFPVVPPLLHSNNVWVEGGEEIRLKLTYTDHLRLDGLERMKKSRPQPALPTTVLIPEDGILRLNHPQQPPPELQDLAWGEGLTVLDTSQLPWMGLWALSLGAAQVYVAPKWKEILSQVAGPQLSSQLREWSGSELDLKFDVVLADPREGTMLAPGFFSPCLREQYMKADVGRMIPSQVELSAVLLHSPELLKTAQVFSPQLTLGFQIGPVINMYETVLQPEVWLTPDMATSQPVSLAILEAGTSTASNATTICCRSTVSAVAFWLGPPHPWPPMPVACYFLRPAVKAKSQVKLKWSLSNGYLHFSL